MTDLSGREVMRVAENHGTELAQEFSRLTKAERDHVEKGKAVALELDAAWNHLTSLLVTDLQAESLDGAARALHLPIIGSAQVFARGTADQQKLQQEIARVEKGPIYVDREARLLKISIQSRELEEFAQPLRDSVQRCESTAHFNELMDVGFATTDYQHGWWTLSYYRHRRLGSQLVDTLAKSLNLPDFPSLRQKYYDERSTLVSLESSLSELRSGQATIDRLIKSRDAAIAGLADLPRRHLAQTRELVRQHLSSLFEKEQLALVASRADLTLAMKRIHGVLAKQQYLDNILNEWITKPKSQITEAIQRNRREIDKLRRPKNMNRHYPRADVEKRFRSRREQWDKRYNRYHTTSDRIVVFDHYDRYNPYSEFLWWDLMTDGRIDGNFIPEVSGYYDSHPDWHYDRHHHYQQDDAISSLASDSVSSSSDTSVDAS